MNKEAVNHPSHYNTGKYEVIDVIEDWGLGFNDGNAIKYIARHKHKGKPLEDLKKAAWYIERLINHYERLEDPVCTHTVHPTPHQNLHQKSWATCEEAVYYITANRHDPNLYRVFHSLEEQKWKIAERPPE
jgi:hypothetical protein